MKKVSLERLPAEVQAILQDVESHRILITRSGEPFAVVASAGGKDEAELELEESPEFWRMIRERRCETESVTLEAVRAELTTEEELYERAKKLFDPQEMERIEAPEKGQGRPLAEFRKELKAPESAG